MRGGEVRLCEFFCLFGRISSSNPKAVGRSVQVSQREGHGKDWTSSRRAMASCQVCYLNTVNKAYMYDEALGVSILIKDTTFALN